MNYASLQPDRGDLISQVDCGASNDARAHHATLLLGMLPDLKLVLRLQEIDNRLAELQKEIAALPKHIAEIEKKLVSHERKLEADRAALASLGELVFLELPENDRGTCRCLKSDRRRNVAIGVWHPCRRRRAGRAALSGRDGRRSRVGPGPPPAEITAASSSSAALVSKSASLPPLEIAPIISAIRSAPANTPSMACFSMASLPSRASPRTSSMRCASTERVVKPMRADSDFSEWVRRKISLRSEGLLRSASSARRDSPSFWLSSSASSRNARRSRASSMLPMAIRAVPSARPVCHGSC